MLPKSPENNKFGWIMLTEALAKLFKLFLNWEAAPTWLLKISRRNGRDKPRSRFKFYNTYFSANWKKICRKWLRRDWIIAENLNYCGSFKLYRLKSEWSSEFGTNRQLLESPNTRLRNRLFRLILRRNDWCPFT